LAEIYPDQVSLPSPLRVPISKHSYLYIFCYHLETISPQATIRCMFHTRHQLGIANIGAPNRETWILPARISYHQSRSLLPLPPVRLSPGIQPCHYAPETQFATTTSKSAPIAYLRSRVSSILFLSFSIYELLLQVIHSRVLCMHIPAIS
jgi:hypothetical protein